MDVKAELIKGLQSTPKYLPVWYRYDKQGSILNDRCLFENPDYYFYKSEISAIRENVNEIVSLVTPPCTLVDMGSGNSEKSRIFIDALLEKQNTLVYIPVDISEEFLKETSEALVKDYKGLVDVQPIPGDYSIAIQKLRDISANKLIIWLGGGFQNQAYDMQMHRIDSLSHSMTNKDCLLLTLDITQNEEEIRKAYFDETGTGPALYSNAIWRLNRDYGCNFKQDDLDLEYLFVRETDKHGLSKVLVRARFKGDNTQLLPDLGIHIKFTEGEYLNLYEGEGVSCKYTEEQINTLVESGNQVLDRILVDRERHVALCCVKTQRLSLSGSSVSDRS